MLNSLFIGWAGSSAYINGTGIVFWKTSPEPNAAAETDGFLVDSMTVPGTSFRRNQIEQWSDPSVGSRIGEVINHVVLDNHIVFITHHNKVFAYPADLDDFDPEFIPVEITTFSQSSDFTIADIQGSFRNFGVFSKSGAVLLGNTTLLEAFTGAARAVNPPTADSLPHPTIPRALQNASVISLAFGDYHYHALHTNGTISSYGHESQACGALGLGSPKCARARGVDYTHQPGTGVLGRPEWTDGRTTVWFETEKNLWLKSIVIEPSGDIIPQPLPRLESLDQLPVPAQNISELYSEWIEQEGRNWHLGPQEDRKNISSSRNDSDHDKGAYFALKVTAAGWHSGALVLVDSAKAERVRQKYIVPPLSIPSDQDRRSGELQAENSAFYLEQVSQAVTACGRWLYESGRRFLGLTARDEMNTPEPGNQGGNESSKVREKKTTWVWEGKGVPKLRLVGGTVVPVGGEVVTWRDGVPDW